MNTETLDALLIDRALGELTPATADLLEAYLAQNPAAMARAAAIDDTSALARAALGPRAMAADQPVPSPTWRARAGAPWRRVGPAWWQLAACLALGAAVGWIGRHAAGTVSSPHVEVVRATNTASDRAESPPAERAGDFWSVRILAAESNRARADRVSGRYRLRWESPAKMPHLEEIR